MLSSMLLMLGYCLLNPSMAENIAAGRSAYQSGVVDWTAVYSAGRPVDRDNNTCAEINNKDIIVTYPNNATWWVDLGSLHEVNDVIVRNTNNITAYVHLEHFTISVSETDTGIREVCGTYTTTVPRGGSATIQCDERYGRWVWFEKVGGADRRVATLCEVEVHGRSFGPVIRIPLRGWKTNQTGGRSDMAVDGSSESCVYADNTDGQGAEWWIDLERMYRISTITLINTYDGGAYHRMNNFTLRVYSGPGAYLTCADYTRGPVPAGKSVTFECPDNVIGQYVQFLRLGRPQMDLVTICEVEMSGTPYDGTTTTTTKIITTTTTTTTPTTPTTTTTASTTASTAWSTRTGISPTGPVPPITLTGLTTNQTGVYGGQTSDKAVDGSTSTCAHPDNPFSQPAEWWIDLGRMYRVDTITLYNTNDGGGYFRMSDFVLRVYSRPGDYLTCAKYPGTVGSGAAVTLPCRDDVYGDVYGRYVRFLRLGGSQIGLVEICEVEMTGAVYDGCPRGYYGEDCSRPCGQCAEAPGQYSVCHRSGRCHNGCHMWWAPDNCDREIVTPPRNDKNMNLRKTSPESLEINIPRVVTPGRLSQYYGYRIRYKSAVTSQIERNEPQTDSGEQVIITIRDLLPNTAYTIDVTPYRVMNGQYDYSVNSYPTLTASTLCPAPERAIISKIETLTDRHFEVIYQLPQINGCSNLSRIEILYKRPTEAEWRTVEASLSLTSHVVTVDDSAGIVVKLRITNVQGEYLESTETFTSELHVDVSTSSTLPWVLFGVVLAVVVTETISFVIYCKRSKQAPKLKDKRHGQTADIRLDHVISADNAVYEEVNNLTTRGSNYGHLQGSVYQNSVTSGPYESIAQPSTEPSHPEIN